MQEAALGWSHSYTVATDVECDDEESLVWSILKPNNFDRALHLGWRYAGCELPLLRGTAQNVLAATCPTQSIEKKQMNFM